MPSPVQSSRAQGGGCLSIFLLLRLEDHKIYTRLYQPHVYEVAAEWAIEILLINTPGSFVDEGMRIQKVN